MARIYKLDHCALMLINEDLDQEVSHVMKALKQNGYPKSAIKMSYPQRQQANTSNEHPIAIVVLPYIRGLSEPI